MVFLYNGILPRNKKECNTTSWTNVDKSQNHCVKWKKLDTTGWYYLYDIWKSHNHRN